MQKQSAPENPLEFIRDCILSGRIRWTYHVTMRLAQRGLRADLLAAGVGSLEVIESYPEDKYLPSYLVRGEVERRIFHAQVATDQEGGNVRVVTMYLPDPEEWDCEFRVRST